jgi:hypothetical protein
MSLRGRFALILAVSASAPCARVAKPAHPLKHVIYYFKNAKDKYSIGATIRDLGIQQRGTK